MANQFIKMQSSIRQVLKEINKKDSDLRRKAANHIKRKISEKIRNFGTSQPGEPPAKQTGNLLKGLATRGGTWSAYVGFKAPGFHAPLLEFGGRSPERKTKDGKSRGYMAARPVLFPTMAEEKNAVKQILQERRV